MSKLKSAIDQYSAPLNLIAVVIGILTVIVNISLSYGTVRTRLDNHDVQMATKASQVQVDFIRQIQVTKLDTAVFDDHDKKDDKRFTALEQGLNDLRAGQNQILQILINRQASSQALTSPGSGS